MKLDLNELARQAGFTQLPGYSFAGNAMTPDVIKRFAALVAAAEREVCAKLCDAEQKKNEDRGMWLWEARNCAAAIRAVGDHTNGCPQ